jgi:hypothetical protein
MAVEQLMEAKEVDAPSEDPSLKAFSGGLPWLTTSMDREAVLRRLDAAARRGKLAGFEPRQAPDLFEVEAYSEPFDHRLIATPEQHGGELRLKLRMEMLKKKLLTFAVVILFSIWPGLPLTHSMLLTYFSWYHYETWVTAAWYLPLTVVPLPWMLRNWLRKSKAEAQASAREQVLRLKDLLDGTLTQG